VIMNRRNLLKGFLFGSGAVGLRALATGLPASLLMRGRKALADDTCLDPNKAQYFILSTCGSGDPINANCPGSYVDPSITHPDPVATATPLIAPGSVKLGSQSYTAASVWGTLPQTVLDRTCFWHIMTNTPVHPHEPDVLKLNGATAPTEMLPSVLSKQLAACLGTIQSQPISLGAQTPSEGLSYAGQALPTIPPQALKATLTSSVDPYKLQGLRDQTLADITSIYRNNGTKAQNAYLDSLIGTQQEVRSINQDLLTAVAGIGGNTVNDQLIAAVALIQMKVSPVIAIRIPFGGDNHNDTALTNEAVQTVAGVQAIGSLMSQLASAGLSDQVTFMTLNVFGRTLGPSNTDGRQHNPLHQVSVTIGKPFKGGVIGGVISYGSSDFGAMPINSTSGLGDAGGDIQPVDTLASFGKTLLAAVGADQSPISSGAVVAGALA